MSTTVICRCGGALGPEGYHSPMSCMRLGRPDSLPPMEQQCTAGPGIRCQCKDCRAMRRQLWAVQPEEQV